MADNLNAAQLQAIEAKMRDGLAQAIEAMKLRKWSMEQALAVEIASGKTTVQVATEIYDFVVRPALDFKVEP